VKPKGLAKRGGKKRGSGKGKGVWGKGKGVVLGDLEWGTKGMGGGREKRG